MVLATTILVYLHACSVGDSAIENLCIIIIIMSSVHSATSPQLSYSQNKTPKVEMLMSVLLLCILS